MNVLVIFMQVLKIDCMNVTRSIENIVQTVCFIDL